MLPSYLPPITDTDLEILDALRLERFRSRFGQILLNANLYISGLDRTLVISGGREIGALRYRTLDLKEQSWQVCACTWVKVYANNELILTSESSYNKLEDCIRGESMATAIQEEVMLAAEDVENGVATDTQSQQIEPHAGIIRSMALADIAEDLEADAPSLQSFLEEQNATLIDFNGTVLVTETSARVAYEQYSLVRARQKMEERFAALNSAAPVEKPISTTKETKSKKNYLTWKREFKVNRSSYKKTIQNALEALFPDQPDEQARSLDLIVNQADIGPAIIDKISRHEAYTDKARARENLLKAATELTTSTETSDEENVVEAIA